jgi:acetolactate synthase-1/2/3 large subunit
MLAKNSETSKRSMNDSCGAEVLVANLESQGVTHVFGVPGAKIDRVFDALVDSSIKTVVCRHEQNASFIAQGIGRMTGRAGVCLVTSGPGATNLVTGFATATSEGAPVIGFGGSAPLADRLKKAHQSLDTASLFAPVTKLSVEVDAPGAIGEVVANAFRAAESGRPGAVFVGLPMDVMVGPAPHRVLTPASPVILGPGPQDEIEKAALLINAARAPVMLLGMMASEPKNAAAIRRLLEKIPLPCVCTYQATGMIPEKQVEIFAGRVGLFHNQPADILLDAADVVVTVGYDPIEYDEKLWNEGKDRTIVHIDVVPCDIDSAYNPTVEIVGDIAGTFNILAGKLQAQPHFVKNPLLSHVRSELIAARASGAKESGTPIHPLRIISELQPFIRDDVTLALDMGSFHIWHARYLESFRPRQILISNGQQTLGVAMPWAIAACLARPSEKVFSVSGDGGFLFSAVELETAVRLGCNFVHMIWRDGTYNMVAFQEYLKYGRTSGVDFGPVDIVKYAEAFGATGFAVRRPDEFAPILRKAMNTSGPVLIDIPVDYSHNADLGRQLHPDVIW